MAVQTYNPEFWRWYLKKEYEEFEGIRPDQAHLSGVENVFGEGYNLDINLADELCTDPEGNTWKLTEFIALKNDATPQEVEIRLEVEFEKWKGEQELEQERMRFFRGEKECRWYKRKGEDKVVVTEFDVILESIIEKYNIKTQEWERYYEGRVRYLKYGRVVEKEFRLDPGQTHSFSKFSEAMWEKEFIEVKNMRDEEVRSFWYHVDLYFKPRVVREFNHTGFITFEDEKLFLAGNVLVKFPHKEGEKLELVAEQNGAFPVKENKYVKPPENAVHLPHLDLGAADPKSGRYIKKERMLMDELTFRRNFEKVEEHFCAMIGDDSDFRHWGRLLMAYIFSFFFLDEIYDHFKHVIFLYLYGEGNVGKGELAKRVLDFWGINHLASLNTPKPRTVDIALEQHSQIPVWVDEHVPEGPGLKAAIQDQMWNSWFELKQRATSMMKGSSWDTERKEVRTMPLFCSNFKPKSDHLISRSLILHYTKQRRGPEKHVRWLIREKELLQLLTLSFMQNYHKMNRDVFVWDLDRIRTKLKEDVKAELREKTLDAILQDRQISQFATLLTVYHWMDGAYRNIISLLSEKSREIDEEENETHRMIQQEELEEEFKTWMNEDLYQFVKEQIVHTAISAARHDPLTDYIESIGGLIQADKITEKHFNWTKDGVLKFQAKAVWDEYEHAKRGTDNMVRRDFVEEKLKSMSELAADGELKVVNWKLDGIKKPIRQKGFYIPGAVDKELFRLNFNWEKYRPSGTQSYYADSGDDEVPF